MTNIATKKPTEKYAFAHRKKGQSDGRKKEPVLRTTFFKACYCRHQISKAHRTQTK